MKRYKIVTVCGCGLGSSLIAKMTIDQILAENGYDASIEVADGGSATGMKCDFYITTPQFAERLRPTGIPVIEVSNFVNRQEISDKLLAVIHSMESK